MFSPLKHKLCFYTFTSTQAMNRAGKGGTSVDYYFTYTYFYLCGICECEYIYVTWMQVPTDAKRG